MKQKKGMELVTERTVDGFRRELLRREYSHGTAESYVRSIRAFARWSGGAVDRGLVLTWKARLTARYAPATVNAMLAGLNRFFDFAGRPECRVKVLRLQRRSFREAERELDRGEYRALAGTGAAGAADGDHLRHRHPGGGGALHHGGGRLPGADGCCLKGQGPYYFSS